MFRTPTTIRRICRLKKPFHPLASLRWIGEVTRVSSVCSRVFCSYEKYSYLVCVCLCTAMDIAGATDEARSPWDFKKMTIGDFTGSHAQIDKIRLIWYKDITNIHLEDLLLKAHNLVHYVSLYYATTTCVLAHLVFYYCTYIISVSRVRCMVSSYGCNLLAVTGILSSTWNTEYRHNVEGIVT